MSYFTGGKHVDVSESGASGFGAGQKLRLKKHFTLKDLQLSTATKAAAESFLADFPNGEFYSTETDSGGNNLCGLYAIKNSMLDIARQNPQMRLLPVPTIPGLWKAFQVYVIPHLKQQYQEMGLPDLEIPTNNFSGDVLRLIFKAWAMGFEGLLRNHWGGVDLGLVAPVKMDAKNPELQPLRPQIEFSGPTPSGLPILCPYILNRGLRHWEGIAHVPRKSQKQSLPRFDHQPLEMGPSIHPLPEGQSALSGWGQLQQYAGQPQLDFGPDYTIGLNYELDHPSGESYQPLLSPFSEPLYKPYQPLLSYTPELQVESLRGGCPLLDIQSGMYATPEPSPPSTCKLLDLGGGQDFGLPQSWMTSPSSIPCPFQPNPYLQGPPTSYLFPGQVPIEEPGWTFSPSPSASTPCNQPMSQMEQQAWRQLERIMTGLQGQLQGGGQVPISHVQPPIPRAAPKRRMLSEVEGNKGQEGERPAKEEEEEVEG